MSGRISDSQDFPSPRGQYQRSHRGGTTDEENHVYSRSAHDSRVTRPTESVPERPRLPPSSHGEVERPVGWPTFTLPQDSGRPRRATLDVPERDVRLYGLPSLSSVLGSSRDPTMSLASSSYALAEERSPSVARTRRSGSVSGYSQNTIPPLSPVYTTRTVGSAPGPSLAPLRNIRDSTNPISSSLPSSHGTGRPLVFGWSPSMGDRDASSSSSLATVTRSPPLVSSGSDSRPCLLPTSSQRSMSIDSPTLTPRPADAPAGAEVRRRREEIRFRVPTPPWEQSSSRREPRAPTGALTTHEPYASSFTHATFRNEGIVRETPWESAHSGSRLSLERSSEDDESPSTTLHAATRSIASSAAIQIEVEPGSHQRGRREPSATPGMGTSSWSSSSAHPEYLTDYVQDLVLEPRERMSDSTSLASGSAHRHPQPRDARRSDEQPMAGPSFRTSAIPAREPQTESHSRQGWVAIERNRDMDRDDIRQASASRGDAPLKRTSSEDDDDDDDRMEYESDGESDDEIDQLESSGSEYKPSGIISAAKGKARAPDPLDKGPMGEATSSRKRRVSQAEVGPSKAGKRKTEDTTPAERSDSVSAVDISKSRRGRGRGRGQERGRGRGRRTSDASRRTSSRLSGKPREPGTGHGSERIPCDDEDCDQTFAWERDMRRHYFAQHVARPPVYRCEICGATLSRSDALVRHMHSQHPT